jgi:hypothetical protein
VAFRNTLSACQDVKKTASESKDSRLGRLLVVLRSGIATRLAIWGVVAWVSEVFAGEMAVRFKGWSDLERLD